MATAFTTLVMLAAASAAWLGLGWMVGNVPPSRPMSLATAYVFAFTAITSSGALICWLAVRPRDDQGQLRSPAAYLTHSMLLAVIVLFAVWMQSMRILTPIVALLLIGLYAFLELAVLFGTRGSIELPLKR